MQHLEALAKLLTRPLRVHEKVDGIFKSTDLGSGKNTKVEVLKLRKFGNDYESVVPIVDGVFGRSMSTRDKCAADPLGFCQGEGNDIVECSHCYLRYHAHCLDTFGSIECGCHLLMPRSSSG